MMYYTVNMNMCMYVYIYIYIYISNKRKGENDAGALQHVREDALEAPGELPEPHCQISCQRGEIQSYI